MIVLVLGYDSRRKDAEPEVLYAGKDGVAAMKVFNAPPQGVKRTEILKNPHVDRTRYHALPQDEVAPAPAEPVEEEASIPAPEVDGPQPVPTPIDEMSREAMLDEIEAMTGKRPHANTGEDKLREKLRELYAKEDAGEDTEEFEEEE